MEIIKILSSLLIPIIALLAVYIAYQQYLIGKNKLKFELYEKRYLIYQHTKKILFKITQKGKIEEQELIRFINISRESNFLFNNDITYYLKKLSANAGNLNDLTKEMNKSNDPYSSKIKKEHNKLFSWIVDEYESVESRFIKYLDFKKL